MDCKEIRDKGLMMEVVDAGLADAAVVGAVRAHLDACSECRQELAALQEMYAYLKSDGGAAYAGSSVADDAALSGLAEAVRKDVAAVHGRRWLRSAFVKRFMPVAAAAVLVFAALLYNNTGVMAPGGEAPLAAIKENASVDGAVASRGTITFEVSEVEEFFAAAHSERYVLPPGLSAKELDAIYAEVKAMGKIL